MSESQSPEEIKADIAQHRADLADTVDQLGRRINERKQQVRDYTVVAGSVVGAVVAVVVLVKVVKKVRS